jgi:hypothetical protein
LAVRAQNIGLLAQVLAGAGALMSVYFFQGFSTTVRPETFDE